MKKKIVIIGIMLMLFVFGVTYAWWSWNSSTNTDVTFNVEGASITYSAGNNISGIKLIPVSSKEKGVTDNTAVYKEITASSNKTMYLTLNMALTTFPSTLAQQSLVWEIYKGNTKIGNGNFNGKQQGNSITLFDNQEINSTTSTYKLYIWIDGNQDNPSTMQNQDFEFTLNASATDETPNLDTSGANAPKLVQGLIPVKYDTTNSTWVKADSTNKNVNNQWYDYNEKMWANAILVSSTNRSTYVSANAGTAIPESDVLAYYVWIPRYKYKVWNIDKIGQAESNYGYNAYTEGIDIVFETGTETTGTITCNNYSFAAPNSTTPNETCSGSNGEYYTHPAFWWDLDGDSVHDEGEELEGFWMGKFELSSETPDVQTDNYYYGGGTSTTLTVRIKPNVRSWRYNTVTDFYKVIYDMQKENNIYGLSTDRTNTDSHMLKNMEWGAVTYLTNSNYGRCASSVCTEVIKNESNYYTGENTYATNVNQSTTGNIYGVYDMSGGACEYVMGNMSSVAGSYTYYASSGGSNFTYSTDTTQYIDTYANGSSNYDQTAYNRARLGDATGEVTLTTEGELGSWYNDKSSFVFSSYSWFIRGGLLDNYSGGLFSFYPQRGHYASDASARAALIGL